MTIIDIIKKKRDRHSLSNTEIHTIINAYVQGEVPDYQISAFLMAVFLNGLNNSEMKSLTQAMLNSGEVMDLSDIPGVKVDKHSTGGVGDKTSLILAPIAVAAGVKVPMISGRGLGHTGGTLDKLESIPGFRVDLSVEEFRKGIQHVGVCFIGQTDHLVPADKKMYALRDVTATIESIPLIVASIMSKKLAEGIDGLVLDVKSGRGAFMKTLDEARHLAENLVHTGRCMDKKVTALITDMDQPLGNCVGNALEVEESIQTLRGDGPHDLTELSVELAAEMILLAGLAPTLPASRKMAQEQIDSGRALEVMSRSIEFQGGDPHVTENPRLLPQADNKEFFLSEADGWLCRVDAEAVGMAGVLLGGGRLRKKDLIDPAVGIRFLAKVGDRVKRNQPVAEIFYNDPGRLTKAMARLRGTFQVQSLPVERSPLILERLQ